MTTRRVVLFLVLYYALQLVLRVLASGSIAWDEAEQMLWAQDVRLGYGSQPPLYTWLQAGVSGLLGPGIVSVVLLKFGLLLATFLLLLKLSRAMIHDERLSLLAALSFVFIPEIAWESLRERSHSVLACAMGAATMLLGINLRGALSYALFGLCAALGILSKYNFVLFLVPFLGAGLSLEPYRRALLDRKMLIAAAVFLAALLPHAIWAASRPDLLFAESKRLHVTGATGALPVRAAGVWSLLLSVLSLVGPLVAVYAIVCRRGERGGLRGTEEVLLRRMFLGALLICLLTVVVLGFRMRARWLLPGLFAVPIWLVLRYRPRLTPRPYRIIAGIAAAAFLGTLVAAPIALRTSEFNAQKLIYAPGEAVVRSIRDAAQNPATVVADNLVTGAHLLLAFPGARVLSPGAPLPETPPPGQWLVVWDATQRAEPPASLVHILKDKRGIDLRTLPPTFAAGPYRWSPAGPSRFAFVSLGAP